MSAVAGTIYSRGGECRGTRVKPSPPSLVRAGYAEAAWQVLRDAIGELDRAMARTTFGVEDLRLLDERYARGEIDRDEYLERKTDLEH